MSKDPPDFSPLYIRWHELPNGPRAEIRRVTAPDDLLDIPAFYRLVEPIGWKSHNKLWQRKRWQYLVFLIQYISNQGNNTLGMALADRKISVNRVYQVVRSETPNDVIQLRRVLKQTEPEVNWSKMATQIWFWGIKQKRKLLEDFVLNQID